MQHDLLLEAVDRVAAIEIMGDIAVFAAVFIQIGIEQQHRLAPSSHAFHHIQPSANPDRAPINGHGNLGVNRHGPLARVPHGRMLHLSPLCINLLAEITGPADQADSDHRHVEIGGRAHGVTRKHAQAAGIGGNLVAQGDFHREISNARLMNEFVQHGAFLSQFRSRLC